MRFSRLTALSAVVVCVAVGGAAGCAARPDACAAVKPALDSLHGIAGSGPTALAVRAVKSAEELARASIDATAATDARFAPFRHYDVDACVKATAAIGAAREAVGKAQLVVPKADALVADARKKLTEAQNHVATAATWTDAGITGEKLAPALREVRGAVEESGRALEREVGALTISGYDGSLEGLQGAAAAVAKHATQAAELEKGAREAALEHCRPRLKGKLIDVTTLSVLSPWITLQTEKKDAAFFFRVDGEHPEVHTCTPVAAREKKGAPGFPGMADEKVVVWRPTGAEVLVGYSPTAAWMVSSSGAFSTFAHGAGRGCARGAAAVCEAPTMDSRAVELSCTCGDHPFKARYAWDGNTTIRED